MNPWVAGIGGLVIGIFGGIMLVGIPVILWCRGLGRRMGTGGGWPWQR